MHFGRQPLDDAHNNLAEAREICSDIPVCPTTLKCVFIDRTVTGLMGSLPV